MSWLLWILIPVVFALDVCDCAVDGCTIPQLHVRGLVRLGTGDRGSSGLVDRHGSGGIAVEFFYHGTAMQARECFVADTRDVAPVGVRLRKARPSRTWGMHYADDGAFAQRLGTVGAAIRQALTRSSTAVYAKKGCYRIEKCNGSTLRWWDSAGRGNCNCCKMWSVRTTGF